MMPVLVVLQEQLCLKTAIVGQIEALGFALKFSDAVRGPGLQFGTPAALATR